MAAAAAMVVEAVAGTTEVEVAVLAAAVAAREAAAALARLCAKSATGTCLRCPRSKRFLCLPLKWISMPESSILTSRRICFCKACLFHIL